MNRLAPLPLALGIAVVAASPALAQELTREEMQAQLHQRDQTIQALEQRVSALEARLAAAPQAAAQAPPQAPAPGTSTAAAAKPAAKESAEEIAELQALSRGLVQRGLQLLPTGSVEASPGGSYSTIQTQGLVLVSTPEGISTVDDQRLRDDFIRAQLDARIGLPWRSQISFHVPYDWRREVSSLGSGTQVEHNSDRLGDLQIELDHQFLFEKGAVPDLIAGVIGRFPTGRDPFTAPVASVANGEGTWGATGRVTLVKTIDPLVAFTTVSYTYNFARQQPFGRVHPGNVVDWQIGGLLAISPETSLSLAFDQQFQGHTAVDGTPIAGSDGVAALVQVGIDQVLTPKMLLEINLGIGLNHLAPDYQLMFTLPIRFK
jgi:hypothetical protein